MALEIIPYRQDLRAAILDLSLRAWAPIFPQMRAVVADYVYASFYPAGWEVRQMADLGAFLDTAAADIWVAVDGAAILGWVGIRLHPEDHMGEIYVLAVDPAAQRQGVATALLDQGFSRIRDAGMTMVMVETGDDPGHAPSRATYEKAGFERWPVARYFRKL